MSDKDRLLQFYDKCTMVQFYIYSGISCNSPMSDCMAAPNANNIWMLFLGDCLWWVRKYTV